MITSIKKYNVQNYNRELLSAPLMSSSLSAIADEVNEGVDSDYTPQNSVTDPKNDDDDDDDDEYDDGFDAADVEKGASALLARSSPKAARSGGGSTKVNDASDRLVSAAQGSTALWTQLYGSSYSKNQYYPAVILRFNRDLTYNVKFKDGSKMSGIPKKSFKLSRDELEDRRFTLEAGERVMCKKKIGPSKARMHDMATPAHLRKDKKKETRLFSSDEDAFECTFAPKLKKKGKNSDEGETKSGEADFLVRMQPKENSRSAELERKRFKTKGEERYKKKSGKRMTDDDSDKFLRRLAAAEQKKKQRYKKLQKELRPSFNITERMSYDEATGKIIKVKVKHEAPNTAAFLARLATDQAKKQEKIKARAMAATMGSPGRRRSPNSSSDNDYSTTYA